MDGTLQIQLTVGAGALLNLLTVAYHAGKLNQRVASHDVRLDEQGVILDKHGVTLTDHERRISHIEGQRGIPLSSGD
jgi:hypothetical protein